MDSEVFAFLAFFSFCGIIVVVGYFALLGWAAKSSYDDMQRHIKNSSNDPCDGFLG